MKSVMVYGAAKGGQVAKTLLEESGFRVVGFIDDFVEGCTKLGDYKDLYPIVSEMFNNEVRLRIADKATTFVHWSAYVNPSAELGQGAFVKPKAMIGAFVQIGKCCVIDSGANIEHHTKLGDGVFIAPTVSIGSSVEIGDRTTIGIGATVLSGVKIGKDCLICTGSIVLKDVPDNSTVRPRL